MTTTSLSKRELYLKLRGDRLLDPFVDNTEFPKVPFVHAKPTFKGHVYRLFAKPTQESEAMSCYIEDIRFDRDIPCYILAPAGWMIIGMCLDHSDGRSRYVMPFTEVT